MARKVAVAVGGLATLVGGGHVLAWVAGLMPQGPTSTIVMKTNAGLGLLASGLALILIAARSQGPRRRRIAQICAAVALLLGLATLSEHVAGWNLGIDQLLATEFPGAAATASPNRMGPPASLSLTLLGIALLLLTRRTGAGRSRALHEPFALAAGVLGLVAMIGYLYGVSELYQIARLTAVAWPTAISILLLAVGVLCAEPERGLMARVTASDPGGAIVRALLGPMVLLPLVLGWARLAGERARWFDAAMGTGLTMALFIVTFSSLVLFAGRRVTAASAALGASEQRYRGIVETAEEGIATYDADGTISYVNQRMADMLGYAREDILGRSSLDFIEGEEREAVTRARESLKERGSFSNERKLRRKDGSILWTVSNLAPRRDADGTFTGYLAMHTDITVRKQAEEALARSEKTFAELIERAPFGIYVVDCGFRIAQMNASSQTGAFRNVRPLVGRDFGEAMRILWPEPVAADIIANFRRTLDTGESYYSPRFTNPRQDIAEIESYEWELHRLTLADGQYGVVCYYFDSSALRDAEARLNRAQQIAGAGSWEWNIETGELLWSDETYRQLGEEPGGFAPNHDIFQQRVHPDDRAAFAVAIDRALAGTAPYDLEFRIVRPDGATRVLYSRGEVKRDADGRPTRMVGVSLDVTQRKQGEEERERLAAELAHRAAELQTLLDTAPMAVWLAHDRECRVITGNAYADRLIMRIPPGGNISRSAPPGEAAVEYRIFRDGVELEPEAMPAQVAATTGQPVADFEMELRFPDGRHVALLAGAAPLFDAAGRIIGSVTTGADVTRLKHAEESWRDSEQQARRLNDRLIEADRRKDEFLAILSHELRNPLAPIRYALPALQRAGVTDESGQAIGVIERQVGHLTRLVDDLLDVSRITTGKIQLRRDYVTLRTIVGTAVEAAAPLVAMGGHSLKVHIPDEPLWVYGDAARLSQVVTNLLDNSAKYTPRGGQVEVTVSCDGGRAAVSVRDTGVGIPAGEVSTVFEMFHQVNRAQKVQGGLGIGLALVKRLVELHEGTVEAHSAGTGRGAEFVVHLPLAAEGAAGRAGVAPVSAAQRRLRVLLVDDNADLVAMLAVFVESFGHDVRKAFDGPSAVSAAVSYRPHVVLLDLGLPGMTGLEVARELRRRPETSAARLIALTGWGQADDRQATRAAGFDAHLTKPTDPEALEAMLNCERRSCADCLDGCAAAAALLNAGTAL